MGILGRSPDTEVYQHHQPYSPHAACPDVIGPWQIKHISISSQDLGKSHPDSDDMWTSVPAVREEPHGEAPVALPGPSWAAHGAHEAPVLPYGSGFTRLGWIKGRS